MTKSVDQEILIETHRFGAALEVRAVATDGLEVSFQAPAQASPADIEALARAKLAFVRRRAEAGAPAAASAASGRRGLIA
jgi:hypothetical protein